MLADEVKEIIMCQRVIPAETVFAMNPFFEVRGFIN